jgi:hypothetical protein
MLNTCPDVTQPVDIETGNGGLTLEPVISCVMLEAVGSLSPWHRRHGQDNFSSWNWDYMAGCTDELLAHARNNVFDICHPSQLSNSAKLYIQSNGVA